MQNIQFYPNTKDGCHCMQACVRMILKYHGQSFSYRDIDSFTKFKKGGYSFFSSTTSFFLDKGFHCKYIDSFDMRKFAQEGALYMKKVADEEVYAEFNKNIDLAFEQKMTIKNLRNPNFVFKRRVPKLSDIEKALGKNWQVIVSINPNRLQGKSVYGTHAVLVLEVTRDKVVFHDPGNPPQPAMSVSRALFMKAFYDGDPATANCLIVRKK